MKSLIFILSTLLLSSSLLAQSQVNYDDVAVIVNTNSTTSVRIGNYFQQQRNIPETNMIRIATSVNEEIDTTELQAIVEQITTYPTFSQIKDQINYMVTTKGLPLKVVIDQCIEVNDVPNCSSLGSELALLRGVLASDIGKPGTISNPYYDASTPFSSEVFDIYLVTRLDGYTEQDVLNLIDRSGPNLLTDQSSTSVILDISHLAPSNGTFTFFDGEFMELDDNLSSNGWSTIYHPDTSLLMNQQNVLAVSDLNYKPFNERPNHTWANGSIMNMFFSHTAFTFDPSQNVDNKILLADMIAEGATGGYGSIFYAYYSQAPSHAIFYDAYLNTDSSFNLAESYFQASRRLSLGNVIIGDPKTSLDIDFVNSIPNPELFEAFTLFPNPNTGQFEIRTGEEVVNQIRIFNAMGQQVYLQEEGFNKGLISLNLSNISNGIYMVELFTEKGKVSKKLVIKR